MALFRFQHQLQKKGYMNAGMPLEARCFLISLSVPYQLKPLVEWPMRGRCTLAVFFGGGGYGGEKKDKFLLSGTCLHSPQAELKVG